MKEKLLINQPGKQEIKIVFDKAGQDKTFLGTIMADKPGIYELVVMSDHQVGQNNGRVKIKGIAANGAIVKVTGMVKIDKNAQGVDDFLEMRILMLDDKSMATVEPKLEIEANQVKASHAAVVSQIDESQVFYLLSRGLDIGESRRIIVEGFLKDMN